MTNADFEDKVDAKKRNKHAVHKLMHLKTARILDIIGYLATESDSKRLEFAVEKFGGRSSALMLSSSKMGKTKYLEGSFGNNLTSFFGAENAQMIEKKIDQLGSGLPYLDNDLHKL